MSATRLLPLADNSDSPSPLWPGNTSTDLELQHDAFTPRPPFRAWRRSAANYTPFQAGKREK